MLDVARAQAAAADTNWQLNLFEGPLWQRSPVTTNCPKSQSRPWLKANTALGFILFLGMVAMALATTTTTTPTSSTVAAGVSKQLTD